MFARKPGKGITLEMYIRNTQVNKKKLKKKKKNTKKKIPPERLLNGERVYPTSQFSVVAHLYANSR